MAIKREVSERHTNIKFGSFGQSFVEYIGYAPGRSISDRVFSLDRDAKVFAVRNI
jgi:hypothetical protein